MKLYLVTQQVTMVMSISTRIMSTTHPCYALSFEDRPNPYISEQKENKIKDKKIAEPCLKIYLRLEGSGDKFPTPGNFHSLNQDSLDFYGITFTSLKDKKIVISSSYHYYLLFHYYVILPYKVQTTSRIRGRNTP